MDLHVFISSLIVFNVIRRFFILICVREKLNSLSYEKVNSKYKHIFDFNYQHCQQYLVYPVLVYYKNHKRPQHVSERPLQIFCDSERNSSQMGKSQISDFEQTETSVSYKINDDFNTTNMTYKSDLITSHVDIGTSTDYQEVSCREIKTFCNFDQHMDGQPTSSKRKNGPMWGQVSHNQIWRVSTTTLGQYQNFLQKKDSHSELSEKVVSIQHKQKIKKLRRNYLSSSKSKLQNPICEATHLKNPTDTKGKNNISVMRSIKINLKAAFNYFKSKYKQENQPISEETNYVPKGTNKIGSDRNKRKQTEVQPPLQFTADQYKMAQIQKSTSSNRHIKSNHGRINKKKRNVVASKKISQAFIQLMNPKPNLTAQGFCVSIPPAVLEVTTRNTKPTKSYPYPLSSSTNSQIVTFSDTRSSSFPTSNSFAITKGKNLCDLSKVLNKHINTTDDTLILLAQKLKHKLKLLNANSNILNEPGLKIAKDKKGNKRVILDIIDLEALEKSHKVTKRFLDNSKLGQPSVSKDAHKKRYLDEVRSVNLPLPKSNLLNYKRQTVSEVLQARICNKKNVLYEEPELEIPSEDEEFESLSIISPSLSTESTKTENDSSKDVKSNNLPQTKSNTLTELDSSAAYGADVSDWEPLKTSNNKEPSHYLRESVLRPLSSELSLTLLKILSNDSISQPIPEIYPAPHPQPSLKRTISFDTQEQLPDNMWWKPKRHEEVRVAPPEEDKSTKMDDDVDETLQKITKKLAVRYEILLPLSDELKSKWDMLDDTEKLKFMERQRHRVALTPEEKEKSDKLIEELKRKIMGEEITVKKWAGEGEGPSAEEHSAGVTGKFVTWQDPREENWDNFVEDLKTHASQKLAKEGKELTPEHEEKLLKMVEKYKKLTPKEEKKWDKFVKELKAKFGETSMTPKEEEKLLNLTEVLKMKVIAYSRSKNKGISHKQDPLLEMIEKLELIANRKSKSKGPLTPEEEEMWQTLIRELKIKQKEESKRKGQENLDKEEKILKLIENLKTKSGQKLTRKDKIVEREWDILLEELEAKIKDEEEDEEEQEEEEEEEKEARGGIFQRLKSKLRLLLHAKKRDMHTSSSNTSAEFVMSDISVCACTDSITESEIAALLNTPCANIKLSREGGKVSTHIYSKEKELQKCACNDSYTETGSGFRHHNSGDFADSQTFDEQGPSVECVCGGSYSKPKIEKPTVGRPRKAISSFGRLDNFRIATADIAQSTNAITGSKPSINKDKNESSVNSNSTTSEEKITNYISATGAAVDTTQSNGTITEGGLSDLEKTCSCTQSEKRSILSSIKIHRKTGNSKKSTTDTTQSSRSGLKLSISKKKFGLFKSRNRSKHDTFDTTTSPEAIPDASSRSFKQSRIPKKIQGRTNMVPSSSPNQSKYTTHYRASDSRGPFQIIASKAGAPTDLIKQNGPVSVKIQLVESEIDVAAEGYVESDEDIQSAEQNEELYEDNQSSGSVESIGQNEEHTVSFETVTEFHNVQPSGSAESINQNVELSPSIELMVTAMEVETFILNSSPSIESTAVTEEDVIEPCSFSCSTADLVRQDDLCTISQEEVEALFKRYIYLNDEPAESLPLIRSSRSIRSNIVIDASMPLTPEQEEAQKKLKSSFV